MTLPNFMQNIFSQNYLTFTENCTIILQSANADKSLLPARPEAKSPKGGAINMAKITGKYEVLYIIDPAQGEEGIAALVEKFKAMVEAEGTLSNVDEWGKRRLAYPINDLPEGYYVLMNYESKPEFPAELERVMKITEGVLRCMTTVVAE